MAHSRTFKLGRLPRSHDPTIPQLRTLLAGRPQPPLPAAVDYTAAMPEAPNGFGVMLNDTLGDCTCAAFYHARQVWTFYANGRTKTAPDSAVELLYERACGYKPTHRGEGPGGDEQQVLRYLHRHGAPLGGAGEGVDKILGYAEVDPSNIDDVKRTIWTAGVAYIGFNVPHHILPARGEPPRRWDVVSGRDRIVGGHAVVLPGYDAEGAIVISWGELYWMSWVFFAKYVDEVYAISDEAWSPGRWERRKRVLGTL